MSEQNSPEAAAVAAAEAPAASPHKPPAPAAAPRPPALMAPPRLPEGLAATPIAQSKGPIWAGLAIFVVVFLGMGGAAMTYRYPTSVNAPGQVVVEGRRQTVQHLEGGIIKSLLVQEGSEVKQDQLLIQLDDTRARAQYDLVNDELSSLMIEAARLKAEQQGHDKIQWPDAIESRRSEAKIADQIDAETNVFTARRAYLVGQRKIADQRTAQLQETIKSNKSQIEAYRRQQVTIEKEMASVRTLVGKGLETETRLFALQRASSDIDRRMSEVNGNTASALQQIGQIRASVTDVQNQMLSETVKRLTDVETTIIDRRNRLAAADDQLQRTRILSPSDGIVLGLKFHTPGGVIPPGQPIMDIVPNNKKLIVNVRINTQDIDQVMVMPMEAEILLTAYAKQNFPSVKGDLVEVSADVVSDPNGRIPPYYSGRVEVDQEDIARLGKVELKAGMPTQVLIRTGTTTLGHALILPIADSLHSEFRETNYKPEDAAAAGTPPSPPSTEKGTAP